MMNDGQLINEPVSEIQRITLERVDLFDKFPPLPVGQSSPCSPIDFDAATGLRSGILKKSTNGLVETYDSETRTTPDFLDPFVMAFTLPLASSVVTTKKSNKRVSFSKTVHCKEMRHIKDYSEEEIQMFWLTTPDYLLIKSTIKQTLSMMMNGNTNFESDEEFCTRGLESRTRAGARARSYSKLRTRSAVLNEQDMQREEGFHDAYILATVSMEQTASSRAWAQAIAVEDYRSIQDYLADVSQSFALGDRNHAQ